MRFHTDKSRLNTAGETAGAETGAASAAQSEAGDESPSRTDAELAQHRHFVSDASTGQEHKLLVLGEGRGAAGLQDPQPLLSSQVVLFSLVVTKHGDSLTSAPRPG